MKYNTINIILKNESSVIKSYISQNVNLNKNNISFFNSNEDIIKKELKDLVLIENPSLFSKINTKLNYKLIKNIHFIEPLYYNCKLINSINKDIAITSGLNFISNTIFENILSHILFFYKLHDNLLNKQTIYNNYKKSIFNRSLLIFGYNDNLFNIFKIFKQNFNSKINVVIDKNTNINNKDIIDNIILKQDAVKYIPYNDIMINFESNTDIFFDDKCFELMFKDHLILNYGDNSLFNTDYLLSTLYEKKIMGCFLLNDDKLRDYNNIERLIINKNSLRSESCYYDEITKGINTILN